MIFNMVDCKESQYIEIMEMEQPNVKQTNKLSQMDNEVEYRISCKN